MNPFLLKILPHEVNEQGAKNLRGVDILSFSFPSELVEITSSRLGSMKLAGMPSNPPGI